MNVGVSIGGVFDLDLFTEVMRMRLSSVEAVEFGRDDRRE